MSIISNRKVFVKKGGFLQENDLLLNWNSGYNDYC